MATRVTSWLSRPSMLRTLLSHLRVSARLLREPRVPLLFKMIPLLAAAFQSARFIHVVRDGRDVALAFKALEHRPPDTLPDGVIYWRNHVRAGRRFGRLSGARDSCRLVGRTLSLFGD